MRYKYDQHKSLYLSKNYKYYFISSSGTIILSGTVLDVFDLWEFNTTYVHTNTHIYIHEYKILISAHNILLLFIYFIFMNRIIARDKFLYIILYIYIHLCKIQHKFKMHVFLLLCTLYYIFFYRKAYSLAVLFMLLLYYSGTRIQRVLWQINREVLAR